jgi:hypothetical protein
MLHGSEQRQRLWRMVTRATCIICAHAQPGDWHRLLLQVHIPRCISAHFRD